MSRPRARRRARPRPAPRRPRPDHPALLAGGRPSGAMPWQPATVEANGVPGGRSASCPKTRTVRPSTSGGRSSTTGWRPRLATGAPCALAGHFEKGRPHEPDPLSAAAWYRLAAEHGHARGAERLARTRRALRAGRAAARADPGRGSAPRRAAAPGRRAATTPGDFARAR